MLDGKSVLVTGAASGIGAAAARVFAGYGAQLTLVDRDADALHGVADALGALAFVGDVSDEAAMRAAVAATVDRAGRLDGAFNNAGVEQAGAAMTPLAQIDVCELKRILEINLVGTFNCLRAELDVMGERGGAIVNTASVMGILGAPGLSAYAASKHGVVGLTRAAALDYAARGVRVNAVAPGAVSTPMLTERAFKANPGFEQAAAAMHPMGRIARADEVAEAAAWLLSDRASFVTGHVLAVDGGLSAA